MPYIITTHRHLEDPTAEFLPDAEPGVTRRAVATLDEARAAVDDAVAKPYYARQDGTGRELPNRYFELSTTARTLPAHGGTVGPLPDGRSIVVTHAKWDELREMLPPRDAPIIREPGDGGHPLLDAFNEG